MVAMISEIINILQTNQFAQGGLLVGASALLLRPIKSLFLFIKDQIKNHFAHTIDITNQENCFHGLQDYLSLLPYSQKCKNIAFAYKEQENNLVVPESIIANNEKITKSLGAGWHFFWYKKSFWSVYIGKDFGQTSGLQHRIWVRFFSFNKNLLNEIATHIQSYIEQRGPDEISIFKNDYRSWQKISNEKKITLENFIKPPNFESVEQNIEKFLASRSFYEKLNVPYRLGFLFYGKPGNGKTTAIKYLASKYDKKIHILNLDDVNVPPNLDSFIRSVKSDILIIEDIDRLIKDDKVGEFVKIKDFLNAIDGILNSEGRILILTCNDISKIDSAMIRSGRIDYKLEFENPTSKELSQLFNLFGLNPNTYKDLINFMVEKQSSMALCKGYILQNLHNYDNLQSLENYQIYAERNS